MSRGLKPNMVAGSHVRAKARTYLHRNDNMTLPPENVSHSELL
jgi:hypothetical protein